MEQENTINENAHSPKEVTEIVKIHLRRQGTMKDAAKELGVAPTTLSSQLSGKSYLSQYVAARLAYKYGFDVNYLTTGIGSIIPTNGAQKDTHSFFIEKEKTNGVEGRIYLDIKTKLLILDELIKTFNNITEHIIDMTELLNAEPKYTEFCQLIKKEMEEKRITPISKNITTKLLASDYDMLL